MKVQDRTPERLGPYRLVRRLGEGGMGVVYLADDADGNPVAVKALRPGMAAEPNISRRLAREVETMRLIRSPHVAQIVDADVNSEPPYIVTRFVPGLTLDAIVSEAGPLTGLALARMARGLADALAAVHSAGVVHRDLKPGNVMISDGEPVVIDFGIAQLPETTRLTMTGMFMGTPGYLAPEVIEGKDSGPKSDVHSWAATLAFASTGRPPFGSGSFEAIFYRIMHGQADLDTLPEPLQEMVCRALAVDPAARPTAAELVGWAETLDPEFLIPSPPGQVAALVAGIQRAAPLWPADTIADYPVGLYQPKWTRPLTVRSDAADVADLLPPVRYAEAGPAAYVESGPAAAPSPWYGGPATRTSAGPAVGPPGVPYLPVPPGYLNGSADGVPPALASAAPARRESKRVSAWSPLVLATIVVLAAASIVAPITGTAIALAMLLTLRAIGTTVSRRARLTSERAATAAGSVAYFPLAVLRALASFVLFSPVALIAFSAAAAATIVAVSYRPLPHAVAFGAGALVLLVGIGPGSSPGRLALARFFGSVGRSPARLAVTYFGVLAIAAWACVTAFTQPAAFWPLHNLHYQLSQAPGLRSVVRDIRVSLLSFAQRFGL